MTAMVTRSDNGAARPAMVRVDDTFRHEMEPHSMEQMFKLAAGFAKIGLCGVTSGEEALARMLTGRELGLSTMLSMMSVYVVKGMPSLSAKLKHSLCLSRPDVCEEFRLIESDATKATFRAKRKGEPAQDFTFTIEDAKRAGYLDPKKPDSAWNCNPCRMLEARAKGHAADVLFPELLNGLATREEMEDVRIQITQVPNSTTTPSAQPGATGLVVDAPARDVDAELSRLKEDIMNAKTRAEKVEARKRVAAFALDVGEPFATEAKNFYNLCHISPKTANGAPATPHASSSAPAAPAPASGPSVEDDEALP